ncbi:fumarylacetoacetate hydrolase family protein [Amycolatopsis anabasis]|uniref:fumarylacetoacetate hydrolase family protein n=1 Tax=Amycolatopsis anabasis TaxID=1840409 RepID=UPI00131D3507|nr:fumarylacetoacetate hydrolase family protein [Amycolatopsis anabasis]
MRLVTFAEENSDHVGALLDGDSTVLDLTAAVPDDRAFSAMAELIESGEQGLDRARELCERPPESALRSRDSVRLRAPLPHPARLRDCGLFIAHAAAALRELARRQAAGAEYPDTEFERLMASGRFTLPPLFEQRVLYYLADHLSVSGPDEEIHAPPGAAELDYELEFAAVVGRTARNVPPERAGEHIFGYTIFNDWSARDLQIELMRTGTGPGEGKDFAGSNTLGPCLVTRDELSDPYALTMTARVNGEEWSRGGTDGMHHTFEDAIVQFSRSGTVHAGEVLGSGTVLSGTGFDLGRHLSDGDEVELEVSGIGVLRNRVRVAR